ncbi:MAG: tRNA 5-methoxyuridine(34)/uridine 5-oxyacetic acid(34) synthase CmoB [Actinomycetota bacterium]|nr:tRNA 5-methoxyuridine(34)/uridine 5-oxyacetic acid(34) synthase CmoB [Actinomycetota bacterium]
MDTQTLQEQISTVKWFHSIELAPGVITPGAAGSSLNQLRVMKIPADLSGRTVLDVGAWDGFFSFEAERRGASRVVASDSFAWSGESWGSKAGFELARQALSSSVEDVDVDVMDLAPERIGTFDLVLLLGVLYHMRHPLLALERVASVTAHQLILETHVDLTWTRRPAMAFYPGLELGWDPTNWWGPNPEAVKSMLHVVGFKRVEIVTPDSATYRLARATGRIPHYLQTLVRHRMRPPENLGQGRAVFHAFK